ncbi:hypothetical protein DSBG_4220 [Desulfosporosinus sp. BG]|nr:hypothetical protein DSBG_4220 [Desulfosporosinus sp. BG]
MNSHKRKTHSNNFLIWNDQTMNNLGYLSDVLLLSTPLLLAAFFHLD